MAALELGRKTLTDAGGTDWIDAAAVTGNVVLNLNPGIATAVNAATWFTIAAGTLIENAVTGDGADTLTGNGSANTLYGMRGADTLNGGIGDDTLVGGAGVDHLFGGADNDAFLYNASTEFAVGETIDGGTGIADTLRLNIGQGFQVDVSGPGVLANVEKVVFLSAGIGRFADVSISTAANRINAFTGSAGENQVKVVGAAINLSAVAFTNWTNGEDLIELTGTAGNDTLTGSGRNDTINAGGLNDILDGGLGSDSLNGGNGNDTYVLNADANVTNTLSDTSGVDTILTTITRALTPFGFIEGLTLVAGSGAIWGYGNGANNAMVGNASNNRLEGLGGNDTLAGLAGCDTLAGGADNDTFRFLAAGDSAVGALRDVITDFDDLGNDVVDLSLMAGVTAYIGAANFTAAGQVRAIVSGANVLIQINTLGATGAESEILLLNTTLGNGVGQLGTGDILV